MEIVNKNIRFLREEAGWTQKELAAKLDVKHPVIGSYEEFRSVPPIPIATRIADAFKVDLDTLIREDLAKGKKKRNQNDRFSRGKDVLAITVNSEEKENVEFVSQKASAGYLAGYHDTEYLSELPKTNLPFLPSNRTHRAFEITGDSMLPIPSKSIVIGAYVANLSEIKNGDAYIVVTNEGITYKRVYNFLKESSGMLLVSDNPQVAPYFINDSDVLEVWKKVKIIIDDLESKTSLTGNDMASFALNIHNELKRKK